MPDYSAINLGASPIIPIGNEGLQSPTLSDMIKKGLTQSPVQYNALSDIPTGNLANTKMLPNVTVYSTKKSNKGMIFFFIVFYFLIFYLLFKTIKK
jgi:hypothetical protein